MVHDATKTLPATGRVVSSEIPTTARFFYGVIALAALFVAWLGIAKPERLDESFTWAVLPPLHARFVGVLYLFGAVYLVGCILAHRWSQVSPALPAIGLFASLLLLVTLLNLEAFDYDLTPVWVWTLSYVIYPAIAFALAWVLRHHPAPAARGPALPAWATKFLVVQAGAFAVLGVILLVARDVAVEIWPWKISSGLAQFYGGPFLAYAFCSWRYSRRRGWAEVAAIVPAMLVFTAGTVIVSLVHGDLFSSELSTWVWFGGFGAAAVILLVMTARSIPAALADRRAAPVESAPSG
jgi:hypothetical protein